MALTGQALADYGEDQFLSFFKGTTLTPPATWGLGLFTTNPADNGTGGAPANGAEMGTTANLSTSYAAYTRMGITASSGWSAIGTAASDSTGRQISNGAVITFPTNGNTSVAVNVSGVGLWDNTSGGNLWVWVALQSTQSVAAGSAFQVAIGGFAIVLD